MKLDVTKLKTKGGFEFESDTFWRFEPGSNCAEKYEFIKILDIFPPEEKGQKTEYFVDTKELTYGTSKQIIVCDNIFSTEIEALENGIKSLSKFHRERIKRIRAQIEKLRGEL